MRKLLTLLLLFCASNSYSQTYSYRFEGKVDYEKSNFISSQLVETKLFGEVKFRLKENTGELWFTIVPNEIKSEDAPNYARIVKGILIENQLQPIDLIEIK